MVRRRRGIRKFQNLFFVLGAWGVFFAVIFWVSSVVFFEIVAFFHSKLGIALSIPAVSGIIIYKYKQKKTKARLLTELAKVQVSDDRKDYIIINQDYKRGNAKENLYRKKFQLVLLQIFENKCAKCGSNDNGLDLDHFFISKNEGGCFILRHADGIFINNAIPLCQSCNRSKSDKNYRSFFTADECIILFQKNVIITKLINEKAVLDAEGNVIKTQRKKIA